MVAHWAVDFVSAWRQIKLHGLGFARAQIGLKFFLDALTLNLKVMLGRNLSILGTPPRDWSLAPIPCDP
jgi:hypothetical protein